MTSIIEGKIENKFKEKGIIRTDEIIKKNINYNDIQTALKKGEIIKIKRGLYRVSKSYKGIESDFENVTAASPYSVVFLTSALNYYGFTTYIPPKVTVLMPMNMTFLKIENPPVKIYYSSIEPYYYEVEEKETENGMIRITTKERTVCDVFRYRKKIGMDIAIEGLKEYLKSKRQNINNLIKIADKLRIKNVMMPFIIAIQG